MLVGPSGCGKTTSLRMLAGLERPSHGRIWMGDQDVTDVPTGERDISMVFQSYALYPNMTVYKNLAFGPKVRKEPKSTLDQRINEVADLLRIRHLLERAPAALSGGQRQRVALGRALIREPQVFLMDEPLSNLDAALRVQMRAELIRLHHRLEEHDDRLRHPRPGRGAHHGRPRRGPEGRGPAPGRQRQRPLRVPRVGLRRRVHWLAQDERRARAR